MGFHPHLPALVILWPILTLVSVDAGLWVRILRKPQAHLLLEQMLAETVTKLLGLGEALLF